MKTSRYFIAAASAIALTACAGGMVQQESNPQTKEYEFTVGFAGDTKTVAQPGGEVLWSPNKEITIFYGSQTKGKFTSTNTSAAAKTTFKGSFDSFEGAIEVGKEDPDFWAVYPYDESASCDGSSVTVSIPSVQTAVAASFDNNLFPCVARSTNLSLSFYNVCGGIMFTVSQDGIYSVTLKGNNNENLAGNVTVRLDENNKPIVDSVQTGSKEITVTAPDGKSFVPGTEYYFVSLPVYFSAGFSLSYKKISSEGVYSTLNAKTIQCSVFGKVLDKDKDLTFYSAGANCFVISSYGSQMFSAKYKGNSTTEEVGDIASAEVLWESFGTGVTPNVGDVVSNVSYSNGFVKFKANADGNAVIAVKDASSNILWSWHIWVCKGFDPSSTAQVYNNNAGTMMDRNLGATSATPGNVHALGLLYQWGRKDPFLSSSSISSNSIAASTLSWPSAVSSNVSNGTIAYAVAHPTTYITYNSDNYDWYYTGSSSTDNARWQTSDMKKGLYDPCPAGWRVPDGGSNGVWSKAFGISSWWQPTSNWDSTHKGMDFGNTDRTLGTETIWYSAAGYRYGGGGPLYHAGNNGYYWSCLPNGYRAYYLYFDDHCGVYPSGRTCRAYGFSVRCLSESK